MNRVNIEDGIESAQDESSSENTSSDEDRAGGKAEAGTKSWIDMAWLMLSDVLGTSVLTFMAVATQLGWFLTVVTIVGVFPMSIYVTILMTRARRMFKDEALGAGCKVPPLGSFGAVSAVAWDSNVVTQFVYLAVYGNTLIGNASYLLVLGRSLQQVFYDLELCLPLACGIGVVALILPIVVVRRLDDSIILCFVNTLTILVVLGIGLSSMLIEGRPEDAQSVAFSPTLTILGVFGALTNVMYSYAGQWMYFELMDIMAEPDDFPKAFTIAGPVMVCGYLIVAMIGYFYSAPCQSCDIITLMPPSPWVRVAATLLFCHVIVVYLIKSIVLARYFHGTFCPSDLDARTYLSYLKHGVWGCLMLAFGYIVANSIPFFDNLTGLIGGLFAAPTNFLIPICLYLTARGRWTISKEGKEGAEEGEAIGCCASMLAGFRSLPWWEMVLVVFIVVFTISTMVVGVAEQIIEISQKWSSLGAPFSCQLETQGVKETALLTHRRAPGTFAGVNGTAFDGSVDTLAPNLWQAAAAAGDRGANLWQ